MCGDGASASSLLFYIYDKNVRWTFLGCYTFAGQDFSQFSGMRERAGEEGHEEEQDFDCGG
ncbi:hypothetical protein BRYFOR_06749 [Marvinbryantia formatexigens DSM 14469]|uniref:Uncharacterized protein n=1 Tax=Marvinbryantia formatexigens DSM 14469 TaxID=478749 RepID=C6LDQ1_9FIRM|nr:hypothetical protein BRYFOR_06749 [Marvinbryantia formatexigens DSM 14469]